MIRHAASATLLGLALLFPLAGRGDDWPQWRGPNRDGVWRETGILESIPAGGLPVRWRARIGNGYSGPVVAEGRVFVTDYQPAAKVERVVCFEEATGKPLWTHAYACDYQDMEYGNGPRASPTVHEGKVCTLGTKGHLVCLDAARGTVLWNKDLVKDYNAKIPTYGASVAPLVIGDLVIVSAGGQPDATVIALDRNTGGLRWQALDDRPAYSAPLAITAGGTQQLIVWTADSVAALEPATGKIFWQVPWKATFDAAQMVASPVLFKDRVLLLAAWGRGSKMLKLDADKPAASIFWETKRQPTTTTSTPVFQDDQHFYAILNDGSLACLSAATGDEVWTTQEATSRQLGSAHLTPNGERVFIFNQSGHLVLARLTPQGYQELGRTLLVEPTAGYRPQGQVAWAHPAYANRSVFARNDRELVCVSLAADQARESAPPQPAIASRRLAGAAEGSGILGLSFSPDSGTLALATWQGAVKLVDVFSGKQQPGPAAHNDGVCAVAFSPDGKRLVSAGGSEFKPARNGNATTGEVKLWDASEHKEIGPLKGHTNKVFAAAFSPDSRLLATGSADQTVRIWDVASTTERFVLRGHDGAVSSVTFAPSGQVLASASFDRTVKLWDVAAGRELAMLAGHDEEILAVAIAPDGKTLATGSADWTVRLWDLPTKAERAVLKGHRGTVYCLAFTADSRTLASGSADETVKLWDVASATERTTLRGHRSGITAVAISPDGKSLASAGRDDGVRLWELPASK